jgi:thioredoxin 1
MLVNTACIALTEDNFQSEVLAAKMPVLVVCWASWCAASELVNPIFDELGIEFIGQIKVGKLNVAMADGLAAQYRIRAVPTLLLFSDGQMLKRIIGSIDRPSLTGKLSALLPAHYLHRSRMACL